MRHQLFLPRLIGLGRAAKIMLANATADAAEARAAFLEKRAPVFTGR